MILPVHSRTERNHVMHQFSKAGFLRLSQIIGQKEVTPEEARANKIRGKGPRRPRQAVIPLIPVGKTTWWNGVKSGRFPKPVSGLTGRITVWRAEDVDAYIKNVGFGVGGPNGNR